MSVKSILSVDMGGRYTGVFSFTSNNPAKEDTQAYVLNMPDNDGLTFSSVSRTQTRHRLRSQQRYQLARRLTYILVSEIAHRKLSDKEKEVLSSLLRRRGYSRIESEIDLSPLYSLEAIPFKHYLPLFDDDEALISQWEGLIQGYLNNDVDCVQQLNDFQELSSSDAKLKETLKEMGIDNKEEVKTYQLALKLMKEDALNVEQQISFGHKHRKAYLEDILKDIGHDSRLNSIIECFGSIEKFHHLIGNISNLQLRALRWYFNDPKMKDDLYDTKRLQEVWIRAYKFFHYPKESRADALKLISTLEESDDFLKTLQTLDPVQSIPPYEDQNNRRPPLDQTLWLSPKALDEQYGSQWELWVQNLLKSPNCQGMDEDLDSILTTTDRKGRLLERQVGKLEHYTPRKLSRSYVLQRILDRTIDNDVYRLRSLIDSVPKNSNEVHQAKVRLSNDLGSQHLEQFLKFAQNYYEEVDKAKRGLWFTTENPLLEKADIHPPMKNNTVISRLVNNILCTSDVRYQNFWHQKVKGQSTVRSICGSIEKIRKEYGNGFNYAYQKALSMYERHEKSVNAEDKSLLKVADNVQLVSKHIGAVLNLTEQQIKKFANPFSLAQLYNVIEMEKSGFVKTTLAAIDENAWRTNLQGKARCVRLCSDTGRPFDGALKKILDRQAYELAKKKSQEIMDSGLKNETIDVTVLVESNKFAFSASLAEVKKSANQTKAKKKAEKAQEREEARWLAKDKRIKEASRNLCPYTGKTLTDRGEIDHIIPRSLTLSSMGSILNTEANLIYCSQDGNQTKSQNRKTLKDLSPNYLKAVFGSTNHEEIRLRICNVIESLKDEEILKFELLTQAQQDAVRHTLFLGDDEESRRRVIRLLGQLNKTRVNGTQAWFCKELITKIQSLTQNWCKENNNRLTFDAFKLPADSVSKNYRNKLETINSEWAKPKDSQQPVASHALDAFCVYMAALDDAAIAKKIQSSGISFDNTVEHLQPLMPDTIGLITPQRKSIFDKTDLGSTILMKEGIYAEHFLPIMVKDGEYRIGYSWSNNSVPVKKGEELVEKLKAVLTLKGKKGSPFQTYIVNKNKAFDLLHNVFIRPASPEELETATILEKLCYLTQNVPITSIYDSQKKRFIDTKEILSLKNFSISIQLPNPYGAKGKIKIPAWNEWSKLLNRSDIKAVIEQNPTNAEKELLNLFKKTSGRLMHKATRRVWSLPKIVASSARVRVCRESLSNEKIYQLYMLDKAKSKGFAVSKDGKINWKKDVIADFYRQPSLTIVGARFESHSEVVKMDHWLTVHEEKNLCIRMCPGTVDRFYVEITQPKEQFEAWTGLKLGTHWQFHVNAKLDKDNLSQFKEKSKLPFIGVPRGGRIAFNTLGKTLTYWFTVESTSAEMRNKYQAAFETERKQCGI